MLNIAICDDDKAICTQIENIILEYQKITQKDLDVQVFYTGESLLEEIKKSNHIDLVFLDIELFRLSGIDIGKIIRKQLNNQYLQIIYISGFDKYALKLFDIHPLNFLIKPINKSEVIENIELCCQLLNKGKLYFSYKTGSAVKKVLTKDIIYFESNNRKITIFTTHGSDTFYGRLNEIYEEVKESHFLCIHKSYLVNYFYAEYFHYDEIILENGTHLPISQTKRKQIREQITLLAQNIF